MVSRGSFYQAPPPCGEAGEGVYMQVTVTFIVTVTSFAFLNGYGSNQLWFEPQNL
jgi:hypothetical protein